MVHVFFRSVHENETDGKLVITIFFYMSKSRVMAHLFCLQKNLMTDYCIIFTFTYGVLQYGENSIPVH